MAVDKAVDSTQLNNDLTSVANAIRTKGGTSAQLAFPAGFVSAVEAIPTGGGGISVDDIATNTQPSGDIVLGSGVTEIGTQAFGAKPITSIAGENVTTIGQEAFYSCANLLSVSFPNVTTISGSNTFKNDNLLNEIHFPKLVSIGSSYTFVGCTALHIGVFPKLTSMNQSLRAANFYTIDLGSKVSIGNYWFTDNRNLNVLILRSAELCPLTNIGGLNGTPFASGKAGGTIYIPKSLYDHLGDGTSLDYKAATNWSTVNGYGTITWAKIEGSQYENYYADGTLIPT